MLLGEVFRDDAAGGGMQARIGELGAPRLELAIEVAQAPEAAGQEEVLADIAERPLDLAFGLRPIGAAGSRHRAVVAGSAASEVS